MVRMDPEVKKLIEETKALAKDNHDMLRALRRAQVWGFFLKLAFWAVVIFVPLYYLAPYIDALPTAEQLRETLELYQGNF